MVAYYFYPCCVDSINFFDPSDLEDFFEVSCKETKAKNNVREAPFFQQDSFL